MGIMPTGAGLKIIPGRLQGIFEVRLSPHQDERGFFARTYDHEIFRQEGLDREWVQENHSRSLKKGIIRGLHFQFPPYTETKLVRVIRGAVLDVFVDLRRGSPTFGKWDSVELTEENKKMIYIPRGFAHGFCTLSDVSDVLYKVDNFYHPEAEGGIVWNDKDLKIRWPVSDPILSEKDAGLSTFDYFIKHWGGIDLKEPALRKAGVR
ncbi:MAG: dTDP-4-dehydrorhamnose 3,5-epimerase [bacterium]